MADQQPPPSFTATMIAMDDLRRRVARLERVAGAIHTARITHDGREPLPMTGDERAYCLALARAAVAVMEDNDGW